MSIDPSVDRRQTIDYPKPTAEPGTYDAATATASTAKPTPSSDWPKIAGFEITGEIACGGMGRVFAGHDLTLDREVAVKTLLPGGDAERFVTESKITARLPHPGIPPVHALGTLGDGSHYLVMKLVRGRTLAGLLKERKPPNDDLSRWIAVFEQIVQAVGFAHAQGIIHRDLKPSNVMVGAFGEVQVMDWGLAKIMKHGEDREQYERPNAELGTRNSELTQTGTILGTPGYMAPEQARGEAVDARADVFALGAILTVILTGKPPFAGTTAQASIDRAAAGDLGEAIARLDGCGAEAELIALAKSCLAANAIDRPADARILAEQAAAYRTGVEARLRQAENDRAAAQVREFEQSKRRRQVNILAAIIAAVLIVGMIGTSVGMLLARTEAGEKEKARQEESNQRTLAVNNGKKAQDAADAERYANQLLQSIIIDVDPRAEQRGELGISGQLARRLAEVADKLDDNTLSDPQTRARLQSFLGKTLTNMGDAKKAIALQTRAKATREKLLGPDHPDTLVSLNNLALAYHEDGQWAEAASLFEEAVKRRTAVLGPDDPETLLNLNNLAQSYRSLGLLDKAVSLLEETLPRMQIKLGPEDPHTLTCMHNLAYAYQKAGEFGKAMPLFLKTLQLRQAKFGPDHVDTLSSLNSLALAYHDAGQWIKALPLYEETLAKREAKLGPHHPATLVSMNNLALAYQDAGQLSKALPLLEETLARQKAKLGPVHPDTLLSMNALALAYQAKGQLFKTLPLLEAALAQARATLRADHPHTLTSINNLAMAYHADGQVAKAVPLLEETLALRKIKLGPDHPSTLLSMNNLAGAYQGTGQVAKAVPLLEQALAQEQTKLGPDHPDTSITMGNLAFAYLESNDAGKAVPLFRTAIAARRKQLGSGDARFINQLAVTGSHLLKHAEYAAAEPMLREGLAARIKTQPESWSTFNNKVMLGASLLGQKNYQQAESLLKDGYEGMKQREKAIPPQARPRLNDALESLVQLYEATGNQPEAEKWAQLLADRQRLNGKRLDAIHDIGNELKLTGKLDADTPALIYQARLKAGVVYVIDMVSPDPKALDPYLYLHTEKGKTLAEDDDSGGGLNARISHRIHADGIYLIRATSFNNGRGDFTLIIRPK